VGRATTSGIGFLPIYLGPALMAALWWLVLRKMIRISKTNRITSIADFVASRYSKSRLLGGLVTIIAVIGNIPSVHRTATQDRIHQFQRPAALPSGRCDGNADQFNAD
jgi:Na+/proline symporter